jgi:hypothetical protein
LEAHRQVRFFLPGVLQCSVTRNAAGTRRGHRARLVQAKVVSTAQQNGALRPTLKINLELFWCINCDEYTTAE